MAVVDHNQSVFDMAVQHLGGVTEVFTYALLNNISITDDLKAGTSLIDGTPIEKGLVKYFSDNKFVPACGFTKSDNEIQLSGIDYWGIGVDFIVS